MHNQQKISALGKDHDIQYLCVLRKFLSIAVTRFFRKIPQMAIYSVEDDIKYLCGFFSFSKVTLELIVKSEIAMEEERSERKKDWTMFSFIF